MKKVFTLFSLLVLLLFVVVSCGGSEKKQVKPDDPTDPEVVDTDTDTEPTDTASESNCGNRIVDEGESCDGNPVECSEINPAYTGYASCKADCAGWDISTCQMGENPEPTDPTESTDPTDTTDPTNSGETEPVFVFSEPYFASEE